MEIACLCAQHRRPSDRIIHILVVVFSYSCILRRGQVDDQTMMRALAYTVLFCAHETAAATVFSVDHMGILHLREYIQCSVSTVRGEKVLLSFVDSFVELNRAMIKS